MPSAARATTPPVVRCAIYTRKSTEEGLEQEFNSLDAQRESGEAYIKSQAHEGWACLPDRYDDGGFTGGNMDRPALRRLLADIEAGKVDVVVVYKIDRFSRSLLDFARMIDLFDKRRISFVSVTQQFNTATSMGRLVLNVLLSFAQFEREIIAERTRDKIAATRRKGKWSGGMPLLGYDVDPRGSRLMVNAEEADQVRAIFALYLEHGSMLPVVQELERRGWVGKQWQTKKGHARGGQPFTRTSLHRLLTNPTYIGQVRYKDERHTGEHAGIVDADVWQRVQSMLQRNGRTGGPLARDAFTGLLKGLLRCAPCNCSMTPSHTAKGNKKYRYYTCVNAQKRGWQKCPSKSIPAAQIEGLVVGQIKGIGHDPALLDAVLAQAKEQEAARTAEGEAEQRGLERELARHHADVRKLTGQVRPGEDNAAAIARLADLHEQIGKVEERLAAAREQMATVHRGHLDDEAAADLLRLFDPVWDALAPTEQARVIALLVEGVDYDGAQGKVAIRFHASGVRTLADELAANQANEER